MFPESPASYESAAPDEGAPQAGVWPKVVLGARIVSLAAAGWNALALIPKAVLLILGVLLIPLTGGIVLALLLLLQLPSYFLLRRLMPAGGEGELSR